MGPQTLDPELNIRWDSARAYYYPVENRSNLRIVQGTVKRITWAPEKRKRSSCDDSCLIANGVEFLDEDGNIDVIEAKIEVIISAGTVRTPLVLEGSGIGNPRFETPSLRTHIGTESNYDISIRILESLGIETQVDLPSVGENLIEQTNIVLAYSGDLESSASAYHTFVTAADLFGSDITAVEASTRASLSKWAQAAVDASGSDALNITAVEKLLSIQHDLIFKRNITAAEIITVIAPGLLASNYWYLLPFSRGSVHLGSAEQINNPLIDPRYFLADFDLNATVITGKMAQKYWLSEPMNTFVAEPLIPGSDVLPNNATNSQWESFSQQYCEFSSYFLLA